MIPLYKHLLTLNIDAMQSVTGNLTWKNRRDLSRPEVNSRWPEGWNPTDFTVALLGSSVLASFKRVASRSPAGTTA